MHRVVLEALRRIEPIPKLEDYSKTSPGRPSHTPLLGTHPSQSSIILRVGNA
jgi:hypothetical protein